MHPAAARIFIAAASAAAAQISKDVVAAKPAQTPTPIHSPGVVTLPDGTKLRITVLSQGAE